MAREGLARLGGVCGLLYVLLLMPAYVVGYPDAPTPASATGEVISYFGASPDTFVLANGTLAVFSSFFFLWFLGALHGLLRAAEGAERGFLSSVALAGGTMFIVLSCAGYAAELMHPAAQVRFENFLPDAQQAFVSLAFSSWLYHFCQVGASVLVLATSLAALGTGVLPRWMVLVGAVVSLLTLLHFLLPLPASVAGLLWVAAVSVLMLAGSGRASSPRRLAR